MIRSGPSGKELHVKPAVTLCLLGAVALFVLAQSATASQGRDLVIDPNALDPFIEEALFDGSHCAVEEGCTQPGARTNRPSSRIRTASPTTRSRSRSFCRHSRERECRLSPAEDCFSSPRCC